MAPLTKYTVKRGAKTTFRTDDFDLAFDDFLSNFPIPRTRADLGDDLREVYRTVKVFIEKDGHFTWGKAKILLNKEEK